MTKRKTTELKKRRGGRGDVKASEAGGRAEAGLLSSPATRETIESVIIAFVLAFLFRTFQAEAFVIPTGSMAPTLMGKHKDVDCPMCHYRYQTNASDQNDKPVPVSSTTCPMCHFQANVAPNNPQGQDYPSFDGDRILVAKFPYEFEDPKRWDVVVFKYPGNATVNYIKRLVGLPGETIRIRDGDLWIHKSNMPPDRFEIARKPPNKILAMLQPVYDNDLSQTIVGDLHWPARWTADNGEKDAKWSEGKDLTSFESPSGTAESWIRYQNRVPTPQTWRDVADASGPSSFGLDEMTREQWLQKLHDHPPSDESVKPQLISDFAAYNTSLPSPNGMHWVGDLAVQFDLESRSSSGTVAAEMVKGGRHFQCRFDLGAGTCEMTISGAEPAAGQFHPTASTPVKGMGHHRVMFSNVDDQLRLWVDGSLVKFGSDQGTENDTATEFDSTELRDHVPQEADLTPVSIGAKSAAVGVSHIKIFRDVYYIAVFRKEPDKPGERQSPLTDFTDVERGLRAPPDLSNPAEWDRFSHGPNGNMKSVDIPLAPPNRDKPEKDQFFVMGDNSPQSQDGRLWCTDPNWRGSSDREWWVDRELFIGKALFIYWPHGWPVRIGKVPLVPFINPIPNFGRMRLVR